MLKDGSTKSKHNIGQINIIYFYHLLRSKDTNLIDARKFASERKFLWLTCRISICCQPQSEIGIVRQNYDEFMVKMDVT